MTTPSPFLRNFDYNTGFFSNLLRQSENFLKKAQEVNTDMAVIDHLRQVLTPPVFQEAEKILQTKAVSSIPIRITVNKGQAAFLVDATGTDAATVNQELSKILNTKFSAKATQIIHQSLGNKIHDFEFGLTTVESP